MKRNWHHWEKWECVHAGMYGTETPSHMTPDQALKSYTEFLSNLKLFEKALNQVLLQWSFSCEQFLSNPGINRIAWLGQSSMCITSGVPRRFKAGFALLTDSQKIAANEMAEKYLNRWLGDNEDIGDELEEIPSPVGLRLRIWHYIRTWIPRGYESGLPQEVPPELMRLNLAPSYRAIAQAILKNDHSLSSLGYSQPVSPWYNTLKRIEIEKRGTMQDPAFL